MRRYKLLKISAAILLALVENTQVAYAGLCSGLKNCLIDQFWELIFILALCAALVLIVAVLPVLIESVAAGLVEFEYGKAVTPKKETAYDYPNIPTPLGVDIDKNIEEAQKHFLNPLWFYNQVHNKGPWDYKQQSSQYQDYQDFGNFNYGATGTALGLPEQVLLRMAGWAQRHAGTSKPEFGVPWGGAPYGDDPSDQEMIKKGIEYAKCHLKEK